MDKKNSKSVKTKANMNTMRFEIKINLKLEAVTWPGVWICSHGYLEITIKCMGYFFRTRAMEPYFPMLCHDHFKLEGYFQNAQSIAELVKNLSKERLEITLWQNSRRLAYFAGVLMDLLHCTEPKLKCPHTTTKQFLMKTTKAFPGIIAPKVEVASEFIIKDKVLNLFNSSKDLLTCTNPLKSHQANAKTIEDIKVIQYQRPSSIKSARSKDLIGIVKKNRKQKIVCHNKDLRSARNKIPNCYLHTNSQGRRVSIASKSTDNIHASIDICDIVDDFQQDKCDDHKQICELCRLYKEVFFI